MITVQNTTLKIPSGTFENQQSFVAHLENRFKASTNPSYQINVSRNSVSVCWSDSAGISVVWRYRIKQLAF